MSKRALMVVAALLENDDVSPSELAASIPDRRPRITISYSIVTPESAANGDTADNGWENEEGVSMEPDEFDREDELTVAHLAAKFLRDKGANEASSSHFHTGIWYTSREEDHTSSDSTEYNYHLKDFTPEEEEATWNLLHPPNRIH